MKNIRKLLAILLLFSIFAVSLAACKSHEEEENVVATDISEYSIVRIEVADKLLKDVTAKLKKTVKIQSVCSVLLEEAAALRK